MKRISADVVVAGAGPAGWAAAISAARAGADVLLVERYGCVGGLASGGLVIVLYGYGTEAEPAASGLAWELWERIRGEDALGLSRGDDWVVHFNPEILKLVGLKMLVESKVRLLLHTVVVDALSEEGRVNRLIGYSKSGRIQIDGRIFVDCTGDADIAAMVGCPYQESHLPLGLPGRIGNIDLKELEQFQTDNPVRFAQLVSEMARCGGFGKVGRPVWGDNTLWLNNWIEGNGLDVDDLTKVEVEARLRFLRTIEFMRANIPGCERAYLMDTASQIGVRTSRLIEGYETIDYPDLGKHCATSIGKAARYLPERRGEPYHIPYGSLIPRKSSNLLTAGRCLSATTQAMQELRVIVPALVSGQGAGAAAALSAQKGIPPQEVKIDELQSLLSSQGVRGI